MTNQAGRFSRFWSASGQRFSVARRLVPLLLLPAGAAYCLLSELLFSEERSGLLGSFFCAFATLTPWVAGAMLFEQGARSIRKRSHLIALGLGLACLAYAASSTAALWLGSGAEGAFFSRLPLLGVSLLGAVLYPIHIPAELSRELTPAGDTPPVDPGDILFACAAGNYVELYTETRTVIWRQTMRNAERVLRKAGFVRVHRSYLVPWRSIDVLVRDRKAVVEVALLNGRRLPVSSRYANNLANKTLQ
jgi:hypothetical protein